MGSDHSCKQSVTERRSQTKHKAQGTIDYQNKAGNKML